VGGGEPVGDLAAHVGGGQGLHRPLRVQHLGQRLAGQVLHHQPRPVLVDHHVEHADHVRVLQARADPALAHQPLPGLLGPLGAAAAGRRGQQFLEGDGPVEQLVGAAPDRAHGPGTDPLVQAVAVADAGRMGLGRVHHPRG
jgi:hypothetical protein